MALSPGLRLRALLALAVFSISLSLPLLSFGHFTLDDDTACGSVKLSAAHPGSQFELVRPPLPPSHCALCHWLRAVGGSQTSGITTVHAWLGPAAPTISFPAAWSPAPTVSLLPSRAPPVTLG
jgi:hypothetical protein